MTDGLQVCECGDYRRDHTGPENRGKCRVCGDGTPPPDGYNGCLRFRLWDRSEPRQAEEFDPQFAWFEEAAHRAECLVLGLPVEELGPAARKLRLALELSNG